MINTKLLDELDVDLKTLINLYTEDKYWKTVLKRDYGISDKDFDVEIGGYLFDDLSINESLIPGKRPIGVCVTSGNLVTGKKSKFMSLKNMSLGDPENGTVATGSEAELQIIWGPEGDKTYGRDAMLVPMGPIPNEPEYFPAFQICSRFNAGISSLSGKWYLPSKEELLEMYQSIDLLNKKIAACGEDGVCMGRYRDTGDLGDSLWSSSERLIDYAWYLDTTSGNRCPAGKETGFGMRVRAFIKI